MFPALKRAFSTASITKMIKDPLVWIDCEVSKRHQKRFLWCEKQTIFFSKQMTGLDIRKDHLIEIAVLVTDGDLNIVAKVYKTIEIEFIQSD